MADKPILVVATGNAGKLREIRDILTAYEVVGAKELGLLTDAEENGETFRDNAIIKARAMREQTGYAVLADDSGLCVDALDGAPGVYSARYAGDHCADGAHIEKLLKELDGVPEEKRTARFFCAMCLIREDGEEIYGDGTCEGRILFAPEGEGGFGYDPVFYSADFQESFGILSSEQKNQVSHRKRALNTLLAKL